MSELKPAYLICGDDEVKLDAWRRRLRARAEEEGPSATLEIVKGERLSAEEAAGAISALTLSTGRRYVLVDGVEGWKDRDVGPAEEALAASPAETVVVFIASGKPPARLAGAVKKRGGEVHTCEAPKAGAYPRWVGERAQELGLQVDREAARALVERIGPNQQRLQREIEKLASYAGGDGAVGVEAVEALASSAVEARTYELADAVVEGDPARALRLAEDLRARGEDLMHILFALLRQLRNCHRSWVMIAAGRPVSEVQSSLKVPPFVAKRIVAQARRADGERLERALDLLADLDYAIRGAGRLDSDSALTLTLARAASR